MEEIEPSGDGLPSPPVTDINRQLKIDQVQHALALDVLEFGEVDERFEAIFGAQTNEELDAVVADLPVASQPPPPAARRHLAPSTNFSVIGDIKIGGWLAFGKSVSATLVIGDILIDVSSGSIPPEGLDITARLVIGDIKVIVPDGARTQTNVISVIGGRKIVVVEPHPGAPTIRINTFALVGDTKVYSLSEVPVGKLRKAWAALRRSAD